MITPSIMVYTNHLNFWCSSDVIPQATNAQHKIVFVLLFLSVGVSPDMFDILSISSVKVCEETVPDILTRCSGKPCNLVNP